MSDNSRSPDRERSLPDLVGGLLGQVSTLLRQEVQLARAEVGEKAGRAATAILPLGAGAALLMAALVVLLLAAVSGLVRYADLAQGWAQLVVALAAALLGYLLVRAGTAQLSTSNLMPERTAEQLSRDARMAKEQVQ